MYFYIQSTGFNRRTREAPSCVDAILYLPLALARSLKGPGEREQLLRVPVESEKESKSPGLLDNTLRASLPRGC